MPKKHSAYFSWLALIAAILVWLFVGLFAWTIHAEKTARMSRDSDSEYISATQDASLRLRALARDTRAERALLDQLAETDVAQIVDTIESVGRDAGVVLEIGQALSAPSGDTPSPAKTVSLFVSAEGTFSTVMRAARLLASLPIPSLIQEIQFEHVASGGGGAAKSGWRLGVRILFLTTAEISS